uniref:Uncharacterized protein n=1 Tax=Chelydra serpentina TaxID=8475 RepID=A0A8C3S594_CHESE
CKADDVSLSIPHREKLVQRQCKLKYSWGRELLQYCSLLISRDMRYLGSFILPCLISYVFLTTKLLANGMKKITSGDQTGVSVSEW